MGQISTWANVRLFVLQERGNRCEKCQARGSAQAHHAIYGVRRGKHPKPEFDVKYNAILLCDAHHGSIVGTGGYEMRKWAWQKNCVRYGLTQMETWYASLSLKSPEYF